eukprot:CAMPEP_0113457900 /NCGR_PEP_ID=MMETSP0014_2-20120614/9645_1 /TAXON_ID=2857 /ORGANISM="Nitzschia sp." /LENGTH=495 /DNA_ID=CAMNT_0000349407 /DNA_START=108 /DNA_END=1595 /DNA_ORIENTATION=- /assembly_acc=CAM_ASM_000159
MSRRSRKPTVSYSDETSYVHLQQQHAKKKKARRAPPRGSTGSKLSSDDVDDDDDGQQQQQQLTPKKRTATATVTTAATVTPVKAESQGGIKNEEEETNEPPRRTTSIKKEPSSSLAVSDPADAAASTEEEEEVTLASIKQEPNEEDEETALTENNRDIIVPDQHQQSSVHVKTEPTTIKSEFIQQRLEIYNNQYIDRPLLRRSQQSGTVSKGIARLGGSTQDSYVCPGLYNKNIWTDNRQLKDGYPFPTHVDQQRLEQGDQEALKHLSFTAYNGCFNPFAPQYAGQAYASVSGVPKFWEENKHLTFPVFVKRSKTSPSMTREGKLLGWEYCGNYRVSSDLENVWTPAANVSHAAKSKIALELIKSSGGNEGNNNNNNETWGSKTIKTLTERLDGVLSNTDTNDEAADSLKQHLDVLAERRGLVYQPGGMTNNVSDLAEILVNLDQYYEDWITIEFVEYDERIYTYCSAVDGDWSSTYPTTARGWYEFATAHGILH